MLPMEPPSRASTVIASRMNGIDSWMRPTRISTSSTPPPHSAAKSAASAPAVAASSTADTPMTIDVRAPVDDPHEHVAAEVIRAERLLADAALQPGRWPERIGQLLPVGIAGEHERPDQAHGEPRHDQRQPEAGGRGPGRGSGRSGGPPWTCGRRQSSRGPPTSFRSARRYSRARPARGAQPRRILGFR